ncbi:ABC transporter substrate-binding protein [Truepera radiovictrix]|uniref:Extracellular solute-binding protein family 1 n=1 Tax=Truepera radiovictrix (strain DSM 17093 / CIP 108686 / LMG 22925 / RQ-24) TaxID=649638 RepID=D7CSV7_TRURR|nr:ABC transporter substrate-binding protein [Truepera radiovictrix]ADI13724.1 extracellular solute-binding protein family 1 [Truepera radiovictrix DSM 17093]WMT57711.1 ABC transporter substrate-binding protein [Truepera radiovictrix]
MKRRVTKRRGVPRRVLALGLGAAALGVAHAQTQLDFWHAFSDAPRSNWIAERAAEWSEMNPEYVMNTTSQGSYAETLQATILGARQGDTPHVVMIYEIGSQLALDAGIFVPVAEVEGAFDLSDYIEPVINYYTINGQVNSIPFNSSSPILYFNRDLMEEAGLDPENPPETFGELLAACEAVEAAGLSASCFGMSLNGWFFEQWMAQQGEPLLNNDNGRSARATEINLTSEAFVRVAEFMKEMNDRGFYTYTGRLEDWDGSDAIFANQEVVFHITSTADLANLSAAAEENGFELGAGLMPIPDGVERNGVVIGGASLWLLADKPTEEQQAALDFVLYMTNTENMVDWHKATGYYPVRTSAVEALEAEGWFDERPTYRVAFDQLLNTRVSPATAGGLMGNFQELRTIVAETMQRIFNGADVQAELERAKTQAEARLAEYNSNF